MSSPNANLIPDFTILPPQEGAKESLEYAFPKSPNAGGIKIAFVIDQPHQDDVKKKQWLHGEKGELFFRQLKHYGVGRDQVFIGGLVRYPTDKPFSSYVGGEYESENFELRKALLEYQPNIVVLVGEKVLKAAIYRQGKKKGNEAKIGQWRGSVFISSLPIFEGFKCIPVEHPFDVFVSWGDKYPLICFDIKKMVQAAHTPLLEKKERKFDINLTADQLVLKFEHLCLQEWVAMDIEGYVDGMSCVTYSDAEDYAFIVPWNSLSDPDRKRVLLAIDKFHKSSCKKILQNSQYDNFVFSYTYKSFIRNIRHDTMLASWELYPELPKALATQLSLHTDIPYYKDDRSSEVPSTLHTYCCTDGVGTFELAKIQQRVLETKPDANRHFAFNMALLPGIMYLQLRGIHYWKDKAYEHLCKTRLELAELQKQLEEVVNFERTDIIEKMKEHGNFDPGKVPQLKEFNPASPKQCCHFLYDVKKYPKQFSKPTKAKPIPTISSGTPALLELAKTYNGPDDVFIELLLRHRHLDERREALEWEPDKDQRMRSSYDCCGTVTGRFSCKKSPMNTGANMQTVTKKLRHLFRADTDCDFFQCDLSGADGWTVAAHCKALGDPTMFEDYEFGLKPAKLIALMYLHGDISGMTRQQIAEACETEVDGDGWLYFAAKRVQHGTNYLLGLDTMANTILKDSHKLLGKAIVTRKEDNKRLQQLYRSRYPGVKRWQDQCKDQLEKTSRLKMSSGHERRFFGRKTDHSTFREFTATEPQANTTFVTNKAFLRLWTDPENRRKLLDLGYEPSHSRRNVPFHVEPLHQVHDALCGQWPKVIREWAVKKVRQWFQNPITIAGQTLIIPFDGAYGPSWEELGTKYGGGKI